jgi:transposase
MRTRRPRHPRPESSPSVNPNAAGLDIDSEEIWACVPEDRDAEPVRSFGTFTPDLYTLADWLAACQIETVAMEPTGYIGFRSMRFWKRGGYGCTW